MRVSLKRVVTVCSILIMIETVRFLLHGPNIKRQKKFKQVIKTYVDKSHLAKQLNKHEQDFKVDKELNEVKLLLKTGKNHYRSRENHAVLPETGRDCSDSVKKILWYDIYHNDHGIRNKAKMVNFDECKCKCILDFFTFNDTSKIYGPFEADGILMQLNKLRSMGHPPLKKNNQVFVVLEREATPSKKIPVLNFQKVVNWTMTYRQDSDVFYPYGQVVERKERPMAKDYTRIFRSKKKSIVWFVSHCRTRNRREDYVKELKKYIDVDIYGQCGALQCARHGNLSKSCNEKLVGEYFFRIAFENTFHRDYVTEKLFEHFPLDMVQIVRGSANYTKIVPEGTVIDVKNFVSPKALAEYLKQLMKNEESYTDFLKRKENYYSETLAEQSQKAYCRLCSMLHSPEKYRKSYASLADWWLS